MELSSFPDVCMMAEEIQELRGHKSVLSTALATAGQTELKKKMHERILCFENTTNSYRGYER